MTSTSSFILTLYVYHVFMVDKSPTFNAIQEKTTQYQKPSTAKAAMLIGFEPRMMH